MSLNGAIHTNGQYIKMDATAITTAATVTTTPVTLMAGVQYVIAQAKFVYGSAGTTTKAFVQTSLDQGVTWIDIMQFAFTTSSAVKVSSTVSTTALTAATTPGDGALADNTIVSGLMGDRLRLKYISTGTYAATTIEVDIIAKG